MIPAFHDYSLEPKITKWGDLLYYVVSVKLMVKISSIFVAFLENTNITAGKNSGVKIV